MALILLAVLWSVYVIWRIWILARFFQLEGYQFSRFKIWLEADRSRYLPPRWLMGGGVGLGLAFLLIISGLASAWLHLIWWAVVGLFMAYPEPVKEVKKRFVATQRATRLVGMAFALAIIINIGAGVAFSGQDKWGSLLIGLVGLVSFGLAPLSLPLANMLMYPVESTLRRGFLAKAQQRLRQSDTKIIGITGSYGKTSTKVYLAHILSGRFKVLATPKSYNTLMGICIVVNNDLDPDFGYDYFVTEMGAYVRGEIEEICKLVQPEIGILIAIGPQHLERFGSIENIELAKYELIEALPKNGIAAFNADDARVFKASQRPHPDTRLTVSVEGHASARIVAENIKHTVDGLRFEVVDRETDSRATFNTRLIGLHNVTNILLATAIARDAGMTLNEIAMRVATLKPEEHRLNQTVLPGGIIVLDDAYNTNPVGAANALQVLSLYENRRILITPGMVELADQQDAENEKLGQLAATACTDIVLVGRKQTEPIRRGVQSTDFDPANLHVFDTIAEAIQWYQGMVRPGDAVLFLNDLSDNYL